MNSYSKSLLILPLLGILLSACGEDTRDWPTIPVSSKVESIYLVNIDYCDTTNGFMDTLGFSSVEEIKYVVSLLTSQVYSSDPYIEADFVNYFTITNVSLFSNREEDPKLETFRLYSKGYTNSFVVFGDHEVHRVAGDIDWIYRWAKAKSEGHPYDR